MKKIDMSSSMAGMSALFPSSIFHSPPPDLTGRKRVYCGGCSRKWLMIHPDDFQWEIFKRSPWLCESCVRIEAKKRKADEIYISCSACKISKLKIRKDVAAVFLNTKWICDQCRQAGVVK